METFRRTGFLVQILFFLLSWPFVFSIPIWAQNSFLATRTRHPLLVESALLPSAGSVLLFWGVEFEEDSGDFPTTKFPWQVYWALTNRMAIATAFEAVIFNVRTETSSALSNSAISALYQLCAADHSTPAITFRQDLLVPSGGFSTGRWNGTSSILITWWRSNWLLHVNGAYTVGGHDPKPILVSEVDKGRILVGAQYSPRSSKYALLVSFSGAKPIRSKPFEPSLELGFRYRLPHRWGFNFGMARSLRDHSAPNYLFRITFQKWFQFS